MNETQTFVGKKRIKYNEMIDNKMNQNSMRNHILKVMHFLLIDTKKY